MLERLFPPMTQRISNMLRDARPHLAFVLGIGAIAASAGCSEPPSSSVELSVRVEPTEELGQYTVSGTTTLPEGARLSAIAIRPLTKTDRASDDNREETYSILARNFARVESGRWQTQLDLWQVRADGRLGEAWQLQNSPSKGTVEPAPNVTFTILFEPSQQSEELREQLQTQGPPTSERLVQLPTQGQWYLQETQIVDVPLPTARQTPPDPSEADLNDGWGDRSVLKPQPTNPGILDVPSAPPSTTNAPLSNAEFMR